MPTPHTPPEIVSHILALATARLVEEERRSDAGTTHWSSVSSFLCSSSLVCKSWLPIARRLLLENVLVHEDNFEHYLELLDASEFRSRVRRITLGAASRWSGEGLLELEVVPDQILALPSLKDIEFFECRVDLPCWPVNAHGLPQRYSFTKSGNKEPCTVASGPSKLYFRGARTDDIATCLVSYNTLDTLSILDSTHLREGFFIIVFYTLRSFPDLQSLPMEYTTTQHSPLASRCSWHPLPNLTLLRTHVELLPPLTEIGSTFPALTTLELNPFAIWTPSDGFEADSRIDLIISAATELPSLETRS